MAVVRMTLEQARRDGRADLAKLDATTEEDIRRHMIEDGEDPDAVDERPCRVVRPAVEVRRRAGLSQDAFARAINVPVATLRNWEQGRSLPDPAAQSLLALVHDDPERAFKVLAPRLPGSRKDPDTRAEDAAAMDPLHGAVDR